MCTKLTQIYQDNLQNYLPPSRVQVLNTRMMIKTQFIFFRGACRKQRKTVMQENKAPATQCAGFLYNFLKCE